MLKRHPVRDGAVQLGGEQSHPNQYRPILQGNAEAQRRLAWLMRVAPFFAEARHVEL